MYGRCLRGVGVLWKMEEELRTLLRRDGEIHLFSSNSQWAQTYEQISCLSDHFLSELVSACASLGKMSDRA